MHDFTRNLNWCLKHGHLTISDMARWFGRPRATVHEWVRRERGPIGAGAHTALKKGWKLCTAIRLKEGFPVPIDLNKWDRARYMNLLGEGKLERARLFASRAAEQRVADRLRQERRPAKTAGVRKRRKAAGVAASI